jgi:hypothetical protein
VVAGGVVAVFGGVAVASPSSVQLGDPGVVGWALIGAGLGLAAFGCGLVTRERSRFGGRAWTVAGFVILAVTAVVVGVLASDERGAAAVLLGVAVAVACVVGAAVTLARGVLAPRMSSGGDAPVATVSQPVVRQRPAAPFRLEVLDVNESSVGEAAIADLRSRLPEQGLRLLYLWVFDEWTNDGLVDRWRDVGPVQLLGGGGSLGGIGTLVATLRGRVADLIEETPEEVDTKIAGFNYERGSDGRFAVNRILCGDGTWRLALDQLLAMTDVVQMDLEGFDQDNQGCVLELGLLIDRVPVDRFLLVTGGSTDLTLLQQVLEQAWDEMDAASPNQRPGAGAIVAVRAPLVGAAPGPDNERKAAQIERQELGVLRLMLERAVAASHGREDHADQTDHAR